MTPFCCQLKAMLWRNILLKMRNKKQCLQEILFPVFFVSLMTMIKTLKEPKTYPAVSFPQQPLNSKTFDMNSTSKLLVSPDSKEVENLMTEVSALLGNFPYEAFPNQAAAEERYIANPTNVAAGIAFGYPGGKIFNYAIRMPFKALPSVHDIFTEGKNQGDCRHSPDGTDFGMKCRANKYLSTGFAWLQDAINTAIIKRHNPKFTQPSVAVLLMHKAKYVESLGSIQTASAMYFVIAYSFFIHYLVVNLVAEKEKKIREGMKMMGLRDSVWWLAWVIISLIMIVFVTIICVLVTGSTSFFHEESLAMFFTLMLLYGLSIVNLAFLMTPFFKKAQVAGIVANFSTIIISLLHFVVSNSRTRTVNGYDYSISVATRWALCLLSPVAFTLAIDQGIFLDMVEGGMTFSNSMDGEFPMIAPLIMLIVDSFLYFLLAIYFDHVVPGEYGPRYKPWFFLSASYWSKRKTSSMSVTEGIQHGDNVEPVSPELACKAGLRILNISKEFKGKEGTVTAVDELSLDIYEGQITALLGKNGAGKTTLINMLCGLSPPSSGTATVMDMDVSDSGDMERIRSMTGVCPQHDILYEELTCREHLNVFAGIKGVNEKNKADIVNRVMAGVDIYEQADMFVSELSGGQKRKLSVAIALIGNPKILFLDEPTSSMDPFSRRQLWSLLKNNKEGKIILLTTHFMDEADILADRKAIISKGKLKCCGSSLFLKQKFGIGYHLNMVVDDCDTEQVFNLLNEHVSGVHMERSYAKELGFTMPMSEVNKFPDLFAALESTRSGDNCPTSESLGIISYGVFMTSLEEVFLKIGSEEEEVIPAQPTSPDKTFEINIEDENTNITSQRFWALLHIRFLLKFRRKMALIFQIVLPILLVVIGCLLSVQGSKDMSFTKPVIMKHLYVGPDDPPLLAIDSLESTLSSKLMNALKSIHDNTDMRTSLLNFTHLPQYWMGFDLFNLDKDMMCEYTVLYNDSAIHSLPVVINLISNSLLKLAGNEETISISSLMWPPMTQSLIPDMSYNPNRFSASFILAVAFVVIPSGFAMEIVADRQIKARSQLRVAGITFNMYWCTSFLFHLLINLIPAVVCIVIVFAVQITAFTSPGAMVVLVMLFIVYIPDNLLLAYVSSFAFDTMESCQTVLPNIFIFSGIIPYIAVSLIDMLGDPELAKKIHYVLCTINPPYTIFGGIYYINRISIVASILHLPVTFDMYFEWDNNILYPIIVCVLHMVVLYPLLKYLDSHSIGLNFHCLNADIQQIPEDNEELPANEDADVTEERRRVIDLHDKNNPVPVAYVMNLRKEYSRSGSEFLKVAVRNVTFAVDKGEVFGLLGPNGAGKTTTLRLMIGENSATRGKIVIAGHDVHSEMTEAFRALGYCPQQDALWDIISLKEHLTFYAAIKGIPKQEIDKLVDHYIEQLRVEEHKNKWSRKLSGGTQRKVSYAISMLNKPQMVLLDEPSTGMDPQSKRFLWDTISSSFKSSDRGAILTTHYMEEAEALCSRVAIMVNGQLQCIGPTQHLKDKFGSGYLLEIKLHVTKGNVEDQMTNLEFHLATLFPRVDRLERFAERAWYRIAKSDILLSTSFSSLENLKTSHDVEEYSFSQSTLEQVFLEFAKRQIDPNA